MENARPGEFSQASKQAPKEPRDRAGYGMVPQQLVCFFEILYPEGSPIDTNPMEQLRRH